MYFFPSVLCAAGGSSPIVSQSDSRVAAVGSSYSTWEGWGHRPRIWLPVGISWRQEAFRGPVFTGSARQKGNSFRDWDSLQYLCLTSLVECCIFHIFRLIHPAASTDTCECHKTRCYIILVELWTNIINVLFLFLSLKVLTDCTKLWHLYHHVWNICSGLALMS